MKKLIYLILLIPIISYSQTRENDVLKTERQYAIDSTYMRDTTVVKINPEGFVTYFIGKDSIYLGHKDSLGISLKKQESEIVQMFINELLGSIFFQLYLNMY